MCLSIHGIQVSVDRGNPPSYPERAVHARRSRNTEGQPKGPGTVRRRMTTPARKGELG
jgi:hypothetical protein